MTCPCKQKALRATLARGQKGSVDPASVADRPYCVVDQRERAVRCFRSRKVATEVAKSMGAGFKVRSSK